MDCLKHCLQLLEYVEKKCSIVGTISDMTDSLFSFGHYKVLK